MRTLLLAAVLGCLCMTVGCKKGMSEEAYAEAFAKIAQDYGTYAETLTNQMDPNKPGMSPEAGMAALGKSARATGDRFEAFRKQQAALEPPEKFVDLHQQMIRFYQVQADTWREWGAAIEKGDEKKIEEAGIRMEEAMTRESGKLMEELQKLAASDPALAETLKGISDNPSP